MGLSKTLYIAGVILVLLFEVSCVPAPSTSEKVSSVSFNAKEPIDNGANPQFLDEFDYDGNDVLINWIPFSDDVRIVNHRVLTFSNANCSAGRIDHGKTGSQLNAALINNLPDGRRWARVEAQSASGGVKLSECSQDSILIDGNPPSAPTSVTITNPSNNQLSNSLTPDISGVLTGESGTTVRLYSNANCTDLITTTNVKSDNTFTLNDISFASESDDGLRRFYVLLEDESKNVSSCLDLGVSYTLDSTAPTVSSMLIPATKGYKQLDILEFTLNFSEAVDVTNTPRLILDIAGQTKYADYISGSGSQALLFRYEVDVTSNDFDGIEVESNIDFNGGTIKDNALNSLNSSFDVPSLFGVTIDNIQPFIRAVERPASRIFFLNEDLSFTINFSEAVYLSGGTPTFNIDIGGQSKQVTYQSGSGTENWNFVYTIESGLSDFDGLGSDTSITENGASIVDNAGNIYINGLPSLDLSKTYVDSSVPSFTLNAPTAKTYIIGDKIEFTLNFTESVNVSGVPKLSLDIGGSTVKANYVSGTGSDTLIFEYLVARDLYDDDGISINSPLDLSGGSVKDFVGNDSILTFTPPDTSAVLVDTTAPKFSSITLPSNQFYISGDILDFLLTFDENVTVAGNPRLEIDIDGQIKYADFSSMPASDTISFQYTVESNLLDLSGITLRPNILLDSGDSIKDLNNNTAEIGFSVADTSGIKIDSVAPSIVSVSGPGAGEYGSSFSVRVNFDEDVIVSGGAPYIGISGDALAGDRLTYSSGSGTSSLIFSYSISAPDTSNGITITSSSLVLDGATIQDNQGNNAVLTFTVPNLSDVIVDTTTPSVLSINVPDDNTYLFNESLTFDVVFDSPVIVSGAPYLELDIGGQTKQAKYYLGSNSNTLTFKYVLEADLEDSDGIAFGVNSVVLNGGSIKDLAENISSLSFTPPSTANILVDSLLPKITSIVAPGRRYYGPGENLTFKLNFNENVDVSNFPSLNILIEGQKKQAIYQSGSGTNVLTFNYSVEDGINDNDGIQVGQNVVFENFSFIRDSSGNDINPVIPNNCSAGIIVAYDHDLVQYTNESAGTGQSCMTLLPSSPAVDDAYYFGFTSTFDSIELNLSTAGVGTWDLSWEYYNGSWVALSNLADGTQKLTESGIKKVTWDTPSDWIATGGSGLPATNYYYIRLRVSSFTSFSTAPIGAQVFNENLGSVKIDTGGPKVVNVSVGENYVDPVFRANFESTLTNEKGAGGLSENGTSFSTDSASDENSLRLNGNENERVIFPFNPDYKNTTGTYYLWFKSDGDWNVDGGDQGNTIKGRAALITNETLTGEFGVNIFLDPTGEIRAIFRGAAQEASVCVTPNGTSYLDDQWHNLVVTFGNANGYLNKVFVDGTQVSSCTNTTELVYGSGDIIIGDSNDPFNEEFKGLIDDVRIYNFDRDPIQIKNRAYRKGESIYLNLEMNENIDVTGVPYVVANIGGSIKKFLFSDIVDSKTLRFKHLVVGGENDDDGIIISSPIILENNIIEDSNGNGANVSFNNPSTPFVLVDSKRPFVESVILPNNGTFKKDEEILITLNLNEPVVIKGDPTLTVKIGSVEKSLSLETSNDDSVIKFKYIIEENLDDFNGVELFTNINLPNSSILDYAGNPIVEDFSNLGVDISGIKVDSTNPYITRVSSPQNGYYFPGDTLIFEVEFNEIVFNDPDPSATSSLNILLGDQTIQASYLSGSGTSLFKYSYTIINGDNDNNGLDLVSPLELNGFNLYDAVNNTANAEFIVPNLNNIRVDSGAPIVTQVIGPVNGSYKNGDDLLFDVVFSEEVQVLGSPKLNLQIGTEDKEAELYQQVNDVTLRFKYTVESGLQDNDGIQINANIFQNFSEIKDDQNNETNYLFNSVVLNSVFVDSIKPRVSLVSIPANGTYSIGDKLFFDIEFDEDINITNTPRLPLNIGGVVKYANYSAMLNSRIIRFEYEIELGLVDLNGIEFVNQQIDLNITGLIKDSSGNDADLSFSSPNLSGVRVNAAIAQVASVVIPPNNIFNLANELNFVFIFSKSVVVSGTPRLGLNIGGEIVYADYISGSGTTALTFRYIVSEGQNDNDGIDLISPLELNAGTIKDLNQNNSALTFTLPDTSNIVVDTGAPQIDVVSAAVGNYKLGDIIPIQIQMNEDINVIGTPKIKIDIGGVERVVNLSGFTPGSRVLNFDYTVQAGDDDLDGISIIPPLIKNGAVIIDAASNDLGNYSFEIVSSTLTKVDSTAPVVLNNMINLPVAGTYSIGDELEFSVNFSEDVMVSNTPQLNVVIGGSAKLASYVSGSGSSTLIFKYIIETNLYDNGGVEISPPFVFSSASIKDSFGNDIVNNFDGAILENVIVDSVIPKVLSVAGPSEGYYGAGSDLDYTFEFSEEVVVNGTPKVDVIVGASTKSAHYISHTGKFVKFRLSVLTGEDDNDGIQFISPILKTDGEIRDLSGNEVIYDFSVFDSFKVKIDTQAPEVSEVEIPNSGNFREGIKLNFLVRFNEIVVITGIPRLVLDIGGVTKYAEFDFQTGSNEARFVYKVQNLDSDLDGIDYGASDINLDNGTIKDGAGNDVIATLNNNPSLSSIKIDTIAPTINSVIFNSAGTNFKKSDDLVYKLNFSEPVESSPTARIRLNIGGNDQFAYYSSGNGTDELLFTLTIPEGLEDLDGIETFDLLDFNGGFVKDLAGNFSNKSYSAPDTSSILIDSIPPRVQAVSVPSAAFYSNPDELDFQFTFSENINVSTIKPRLKLNLDNIEAFANFSASTVNSVTFKYVVSTTDNDNDGIRIITPIDLNTSATITDDFGNEAIYSFQTPDTREVKLDSGAPFIVSVNPPANGFYGNDSALSFSVKWNETVDIPGGGGIYVYLNSDIGGFSKNINYSTGSETKDFSFSYSVEPGLSDLDGIDILSPMVKGLAVIRDKVPNDALLNFTPPNTSQIFVDTIPPSISSITGPSAGTYSIGEIIDITLNFNEIINVDGIPALGLQIGNKSKFAEYFSGSGSSSLVFRYVVEENLLDSDGIDYGTFFQLNGGSIRDQAFNIADINLSSTLLPAVFVESILPTINTLATINGNYKFNDIIDIDVTFSETVIVTGIPKIRLQFGSVIKDINYVSGSNTNVLRFSYQIEKNLKALSGIQINSPVNLESGQIEDIYGNPLVEDFSNLNTFLNAVFVDSVLPRVTLIKLPNNNVYKLGDVLEFDLTFNKNVSITGGVPRISFQSGANTKYINFSNSIDGTTKRFTYTVVSGDNSVSGITLGSDLDLQSSTIRDGFTNDTETGLPLLDTSQIIIDAIAPTISSLTSPSDGGYKAGDALRWTVQFSEEVVLGGDLELIIGFDNFTRKATIEDTTSNSITFKYIVEPNINDSNGISFNGINLVSGVLRDLAGNDADLSILGQNYPNIEIDSVGPSIVNKIGPTDGLYILGNQLNFSIEYDEKVFISQAPNQPSLNVEVGDQFLQIPYTSHTGDKILNFSISLPAGFVDSDGVRLISMSLNGGFLEDLAGNPATINFPALSFPNVTVDSKGPEITSINTPVAGVYSVGDNLDFVIQFDEIAISQDLNPQIKLRASDQIIYAELVSGSSGTNQFTFRYTIPIGVEDLNGITLESPILLNGGNISDIHANNASLSFATGSDLTGALDTDQDGVVDYLDDDIDGDGIPNAQDPDADGDGIPNLEDDTPLAGGETDGANTQIVIDGVPIVSSITPPEDKWWTVGEALSFVVTFSEPVNLVGESYLQFNLGGQLKNAIYFSGNGTKTLTYKYNISSGDEDIDGIVLNNNSLVVALGSSLKDSVGKDAVLTINQLPNLSGVLVTTSSPSIVGVSGPGAGFYKSGDKLEFDIAFNRSVTVSGGQPYVYLEVGNALKQVHYLSGSGTQVLKFEYIVGTLDYDSNGVELKSPIILPNSVSIKSLDNIFDAEKTFVNTSFSQVKVDNLPPSNISMLINNNDNATNNLNVNLSLVAVDDNNIQMYITNTPNCLSGGVWENFSPSKSWTLSVPNFNNGVYVKFRDSILNETACISDTIFHDDIPPFIIISDADRSFANSSNTTNYYATYGGAANITLSPSDIVVNKTGTADYTNLTVSNSGITRTISLSGFSGVGTLSISLNASTSTDSAGNASLAAGPSSIFNVDGIAPSIPGTPDFTDTDNIDTDGDDVELTWLNSTDDNSITYKVLTYEDSSCTVFNDDHGSNTTSNGGSSSIVLNNLDFKTLWAKVIAIDAAGNETESACSLDNIIVHNAPPVNNGANPLFGNDSLTGDNIELSWTAFSDPTGVTYDVYLYKDPDGCGINQTTYSLNTPLTNVNGGINGLSEGLYYAKVLAKNAIGLSTLSACSTAPIKVDNEAPSVNANGVGIFITQSNSATGEGIEISWNPFSDVSLTNHEILVYEDSSCSSLYSTFTTNDSTNQSVDLVEIDDTNIYYFKIKSIDFYGRETTSSCSTDNILVDLDPPVFNGGSSSDLGIPTWGDNYINSQATLSGDIDPASFTDFSNLSYILEVYSDSSCLSENFIRSFNSQTPVFSFSIPQLVDGLYYTKVNAKDEVGNVTEGICSSGGTQEADQQYFTIDNIPPSIIQFEYTTSGWSPGNGGQLIVGDTFQFDLNFSEEVFVTQPNEVSERFKIDFRGNNPNPGESSEWSMIYDDAILQPNPQTIRLKLTSLPAESRSNEIVKIIDIGNENGTVRDKADNFMENLSVSPTSLMGLRGISEPNSVTGAEIVALGPPELIQDPILCQGPSECNKHEVDFYRYLARGFTYSDQTPSSSFYQYLANVGLGDLNNGDLTISLNETNGSGVFSLSETENCTGVTQSGVNIEAESIQSPLNWIAYTTSDPDQTEAPHDFCKFKVDFNQNQTAIIGFAYRAEIVISIPSQNFSTTINLFVLYE